jgi:SAM-dependent methyltransferase
MRAQRPTHLPPAIDAMAEKLPFPDQHFDASMATFTVHQWADPRAGLSELRRVTKGPVVILTCDPDQVQKFWLNDYAPDVLAAEARRYPSMGALRKGLGTELAIQPVPIPFACRDGFNEAFYGRPEMLLEDDARRSCSAWSFVEPNVGAGYVGLLRRDLRSGGWDARHGYWRHQPEFLGSLYLIVSYGG